MSKFSSLISTLLGFYRPHFLSSLSPPSFSIHHRSSFLWHFEWRVLARGARRESADYPQIPETWRKMMRFRKFKTIEDFGNFYFLFWKASIIDCAKIAKILCVGFRYFFVLLPVNHNWCFLLYKKKREWATANGIVMTSAFDVLRSNQHTSSATLTNLTRERGRFCVFHCIPSRLPISYYRTMIN